MLAAVIALVSKRRMAIMENQRQVELIRAIIDTEETQKTKIASDLHDLIIPELTLTALKLNTHINDLEKGSKNFAGVKNELASISALADNIREIAHGIVPKMFTSFGFIKSLETSVSQMDSINNSKAVFENSTKFGSDLPFSINHQLTIYKVCLEVLNNIRKHTNYHDLTVTVENTSQMFILIFAHDGIGITNQEIERLTERSVGLGLKSLKGRIVSLGAEINYSIEKGVSFIRLNVPIINEINN